MFMGYLLASFMNSHGNSEVFVFYTCSLTIGGKYSMGTSFTLNTADGKSFQSYSVEKYLL